MQQKRLLSLLHWLQERHLVLRLCSHLALACGATNSRQVPLLQKAAGVSQLQVLQATTAPHHLPPQQQQQQQRQ